MNFKGCEFLALLAVALGAKGAGRGGEIATVFDKCEDGKLGIGAFCFKLSAGGKDKELIVASVIGRGTDAIVLARPTPRAHLVSGCINL